jgi:acetylornithine deacetylase/succinyl-diaminopimelate desuccinylase-like protein
MTSAIVNNSSPAMSELTASGSVRAAFEMFERRGEQYLEEQIRICEIPAPPFGEGPRAEYFCAKLRELGLENAALDGVGNCVALRPGATSEPLVVLSAHLDTVFPPGTDCTVRREHGRLFAPGIGDDGCGLVALLAIAEALNKCRIKTRGSLLLVGTVGEEGEGNLRGARYLCAEGPWAGRISSFVSFDGPGMSRITHAALASRRYRLQLRGTGGHSWGDFGVANPIHALGRVIAKLAAYPAPAVPRTSFNVGLIEGGRGVNVIPAQASLDVDLRSVEADELLRLDAFFRRVAREGAGDENAQRRPGTPPLELDLRLTGERPGGEIPLDAPITRTAADATMAIGYEPVFDRSSTDANVPISMGIPAVTLGAGGTSGNTHTLDEWYDPRGREAGLKRGLLVALGLAGLE